MSKILIADDEADILAILKERFQANGYEIITALDGQEALAQAREHKPDLIMLDIMMPKLNGFKLCRMLKFDVKFKDIPIIFVSALSDRSNKDTGREVGANHYFTKPFESAELLDCVKELLN